MVNADAIHEMECGWDDVSRSKPNQIQNMKGERNEIYILITNVCCHNQFKPYCTTQQSSSGSLTYVGSYKAGIYCTYLQSYTVAKERYIQYSTYLSTQLTSRHVHILPNTRPQNKEQ